MYPFGHHLLLWMAVGGVIRRVGDSSTGRFFRKVFGFFIFVSQRVASCLLRIGVMLCVCGSLLLCVVTSGFIDFFLVLQVNARNIKGENSGQKSKMVYTSPITALSEIDF
jgi:hypothetical protein